MNDVTYLSRAWIIQVLPVRQNAERPLVEVHDGVVVALVSVDRGVRVQANDEVVALGRHPLEEVEVADVKEVEGAGDVHDAVRRLGHARVGELEDLLRGRQELRDAGPGRVGVRVGGEAAGVICRRLLQVRKIFQTFISYAMVTA